MKAHKTFTLISKTIENWNYQILTRVLRNGTFHNKSHIVFQKTTGYAGEYRGKHFKYKNKLPEGMVRHHVAYNDKNPNDYIVYMSNSAHAKLHRIEEIVNYGITKYLGGR